MHWIIQSRLIIDRPTYRKMGFYSIQFQDSIPMTWSILYLRCRRLQMILEAVEAIVFVATLLLLM